MEALPGLGELGLIGGTGEHVRMEPTLDQHRRLLEQEARLRPGGKRHGPGVTLVVSGKEMEVGTPGQQPRSHADSLTRTEEVMAPEMLKWKPLKLPLCCDQESVSKTSHVLRKPEIRATSQDWKDVEEGPRLYLL